MPAQQIHKHILIGFIGGEKMFKGFLSYSGVTVFQELLIGSFIQEFLFSIHQNRLELQTEAFKGFLRIADQLSRLCKQSLLLFIQPVWDSTEYLFHRVAEILTVILQQPLFNLFPVLNQK